MEDQQVIRIDLNHIHQIALNGIRRTVVFMGLGLNAAANKEFKDYELSKLAKDEQGDGAALEPSYGLVADELDDETVTHFKEEFGQWVTRNGLRDLVEVFHFYLDHLHSVALLAASVTGNKLPNHETLQSAFHRHSGLGWKLRMLTERFGIAVDNPELLETLNEARNCLAHRQGVVLAERDCGDDGKLHIRWVGLDLIATGKESGVEHGIRVGVPFPEECAIAITFKERALSFSHGEVIDIPHRALQEMCFYLVSVSGQLIKALAAYLGRCGIASEEPSSPQ